MKTLTLMCMLSAALLASTNAAYKSFRVVEFAPTPIPSLDIINNTILDSEIGESMSLSFTCNQNQRYIVEVTEDLNSSTWFPLGLTIIPGQDGTTVLSKQGDEDIATVILPKPLMPHWTSGHGFARVSVAQSEPPIANEDWIPIQGLTNNGAYITVTFKSEAFREYIIEGADSPVATIWTPVDIYGYENSMDHIKIPSQGSVTTVDLANPLLPWLPVDGGWLRIRRVPTSTPTSSVSLKGPITMAAAVPDKTWYLVCTKSTDTLNPQYFQASKHIGNWPFKIYPFDNLVLNVSSSGPSVGNTQKYQEISSRMSAEGSNHTLITRAWEHGSIYIPAVRDYTLPSREWPRIKVFVAMSHYSGDSAPTVLYLPVSNPNDEVDGKLQVHFETIGPVVVAAATWEQTSLLKDGISLQPFGVGFTVNTGGGAKSVQVQQTWGFAPMQRELYDAFMNSMNSN